MVMENATDKELATFGAGCFWSTEKNFRRQFGTNLISAAVGYMKDISTSDSEEICNDTTNSIEVLQISFDKRKVTYNDLVHFFFQIHDPSNNRSTQYRSVIFTHTKEQQNIAEQIRDELQASGKIKEKIITQIQPINDRQFNIAEEKHQNYLDKKYGWLTENLS